MRGSQSWDERVYPELATSERTWLSTGGLDDVRRLTLIGPNWLLTGLKNIVHGLIVWVTSPDSGSLKSGIRAPLSICDVHDDFSQVSIYDRRAGTRTWRERPGSSVNSGQLQSERRAQ